MAVVCTFRLLGEATALRDAHGCYAIARLTVVAAKMGLGPAAHISLTDVRQTALAARTQARAGIDPIEARDGEKLKAAKKRANVMTFRQCAKAYVAAHSSSWKNAKHHWQWENSLEVHVYPMLDSVRVSDVDADLVMRVLNPIWQTKTETATRVRGRIEAILDWAAVRGHRTENAVTPILQLQQKQTSLQANRAAWGFRLKSSAAQSW